MKKPTKPFQASRSAYPARSSPKVGPKVLARLSGARFGLSATGKSYSDSINLCFALFGSIALLIFFDGVGLCELRVVRSNLPAARELGQASSGKPWLFRRSEDRIVVAAGWGELYPVCAEDTQACRDRNKLAAFITPQAGDRRRTMGAELLEPSAQNPCPGILSVTRTLRQLPLSKVERNTSAGLWYLAWVVSDGNGRPSRVLQPLLCL